MSSFIKTLSILLILIGLYFSIRWLLEPSSIYEPLISGITFLIGLIGLLGGKKFRILNRAKIKGNRNILIQSIDSDQSKSSINKLKLNGNNNVIGQNLHQKPDIK